MTKFLYGLSLAAGLFLAGCAHEAPPGDDFSSAVTRRCIDATSDAQDRRACVARLGR